MVSVYEYQAQYFCAPSLGEDDGSSPLLGMNTVTNTVSFSDDDGCSSEGASFCPLDKKNVSKCLGEMSKDKL